ncbi:MAG: peptidylprolyl isomerase [Candidatus Methanoperedenaceae archaeon]|nr:peptidylprolyl isomerase [Candidatus Methanoperedenaceae archaeon]MDW7726777.1 peptidylprolyl isomerase [Candidatus Methanoperedens sp.]
MSIQKGDFIKITYTGKVTEDERVFDTTDRQVAKDNEIFNENRTYGPEVVIVGAGHLVPGLDEDFVGKDVGYRGSVTLPPEKAFGHRNPELIETIPIKNFPKPPQLGATVQLEQRFGTVVRTIGRMATVDFNRYLAGQTISYDYEIVEKIEGTEDKVKGLLTLYLGMELPVVIEGKVLTIGIEPALTYNQSWLMAKGRIAREIIDATEIDEVLLVERYTMEETIEEFVPEQEGEQQEE